jgi:hypothetical protein
MFSNWMTGKFSNFDTHWTNVCLKLKWNEQKTKKLAIYFMQWKVLYRQNNKNGCKFKNRYDDKFNDWANEMNFCFWHEKLRYFMWKITRI